MSFLKPRTEITYRHILSIALPIITGHLAVSLLFITDTMFLSRLSELALEASGMGGLIYFMLLYPFSAIGIGAQILISRRIGDTNYDDIPRIFKSALLLLILISVMMTFVIIFFSKYGLNYCFRSVAVVKGIEEFLHYRVYGFTFALLSSLYRGVFTAIERTKVIMVSTMASVLLNVILNYILIFGHCGFAQMGIGGAALASSIADFIGFLILFWNAYFSKLLNSMRIHQGKILDTSQIFKVLTISAPIMIKFFIGIVSFAVAFTFVEKISERELAIAQVIRSVYIVFMVPIWGLNAAVNTLVSHVIGQGKTQEAKQVMHKVLHLSIGITVFTLIGHIFFPEALLSVFVQNNPDLVSASVGSFQIMIFVQLSFAVAYIYTGALEGAGDVKFIMFMEIVLCVIYIVLTYGLVFYAHLGAITVWIGELCYWVWVWLCAEWRMKSTKWINASL
ncbi:MAG: MATE family efflux transporter [Bacteroidia bacterium]|nr:MATE family efflux transporter [Bacteroidia bacterium]MDW8348028.1 MATE family efflux transporter [Bacteroidia bacterium]